MHFPSAAPSYTNKSQPFLTTPNNSLDPISGPKNAVLQGGCFVQWHSLLGLSVVAEREVRLARDEEHSAVVTVDRSTQLKGEVSNFSCWSYMIKYSLPNTLESIVLKSEVKFKRKIHLKLPWFGIYCRDRKKTWRDNLLGLEENRGPEGELEPAFFIKKIARTKRNILETKGAIKKVHKR